MTANTSPIFSLTPNIGMTSAVATASATYTGTSGTSVLYTAGANGSYVRSILAEAAGTNIATVLRIWINNGSTSGTATNNVLSLQFSLPATTATNTAATAHIEIPVNIQLPVGYTLIAAVATTVASGWYLTTLGGDY